jgi:tetratricopeptide (TPR) repeat protein
MNPDTNGVIPMPEGTATSGGTERHFDTFETEFFQKGDEVDEQHNEVERFDDLDEGHKRKNRRPLVLNLAIGGVALALVGSIVAWRSASGTSTETASSAQAAAPASEPVAAQPATPQAAQAAEATPTPTPVAAATQPATLPSQNQEAQEQAAQVEPAPTLAAAGPAPSPAAPAPSAPSPASAGASTPSPAPPTAAGAAPAAIPAPSVAAAPATAEATPAPTPALVAKAAASPTAAPAPAAAEGTPVAVAGHAEPPSAAAATEAAPAPSAEPVAAADADDVGTRCKTAMRARKGRDILKACPDAFEADSSNAHIALALAKVEFDRGRSAQALAWGKKALAADPNSADAYVYIGGAEQNAGHRKAAKEAYQRYLQLAPSGRYASDLRAIVRSL